MLNKEVKEGFDLFIDNYFSVISNWLWKSETDKKFYWFETKKVFIGEQSLKELAHEYPLDYSYDCFDKRFRFVMKGIEYQIDFDIVTPPSRYKLTLRSIKGVTEFYNSW